MKRLLALSILFVVGLGSPLWAAPNNNQLNIAITQEFENLNPLIAQEMATFYTYAMVGRTLDVLSPDGKHWIPQLAEKVPSLKNHLARFVGRGKNRKLYVTWEINPKAVWGDGKPVTGEDVKFSWEVAHAPTVSVPSRETYTFVSNIIVDKKNPRKFTMIYNQPRFDYNQMGSFYIVPKHLDEKPFLKYKNQAQGYDRHSLYTTDPTNPGLYDGPYVIKQIKLGDHISLVRNPHWWGTPKPKIKTINVKLIQDTDTLEANLLSHTVDMVSEVGFGFNDALQFSKKVKSEGMPYKVVFVPGLVYEHADIQLTNPIFKDIRVRKALVYAIDRKALVRALFEDKQRAAIHYLAPVDPWYTDNPKYVVKYPYSPYKAKKLLDQAGWKMHPDGFRYKNGKKLQFTLMSTAGDKIRALVEVYLQNEWKKVGINVLVKNQPARVFFGETIRKGSYKGLAMYAWDNAPESSPRAMIDSQDIPSKANGYSGQNGMHWVNKKVDKLIDRLETEFDPSKRKVISDQIIHYYTADVPVIPLYYRSNIAVIPANMTGYKLPGHQYTSTNWVENWSLK